jgi:hypothetical protein
MGPDVEPAEAANGEGVRPNQGHGTFEGSVHAVGATRDGWGFQCSCAYRSPLYPTKELAEQAMHEHSATPPPKKKKAHRPFSKVVKWEGWPVDRRHSFVS